MEKMAAGCPEFAGWNKAFRRCAEGFQDNTVAAQLAMIEGNKGNFYLIF
jgi:hypothetical protein